MAHDVFISYSSRDKTVADALVARLESDGVRCWVAPRDILPGADWSEAIIDGIEGSKLMLLVFTSNSNGSPQVKREVERAVNKGLVIVPVRIEDVVPARNLEYFLSTPHWLDALTPPFEQHLAYVSETVRLILSRPPGEPMPEPPPQPVRPLTRTAQPVSMPVLAIGAAVLALVVVAVVFALRSGGDGGNAQASNATVPANGVEKKLVGHWQATAGPDSYGDTTVEDMTIDTKGNVNFSVTVTEPGHLDPPVSGESRLMSPTDTQDKTFSHILNWPGNESAPENLQSFYFMPATATYVSVGFLFGAGVADTTLATAKLAKVSDNPWKWHGEFKANGLNWTHDVTVETTAKTLLKASFTATGTIATTNGASGSFNYTPSSGPISKGDYRFLEDGSLLFTSEKPSPPSGQAGNQAWKKAAN